MQRGKLEILSGNAHPALAAAVAHELSIEPLETNIGHFPDGESHIQILSDVRDRDVFVIQPTGPPANQNVMEAILMIDALRRSSADRVTTVLPYFGYCRQDKKEESRVPISAEVVARLFDAAGTDRYLSFDLHAPQIQGFTEKPFDHLPLMGVLAKVLQTETDEPIVVAPDLGFSEQARNYAVLLGTSWAAFDKHRINPTNTEIKALVGARVAGRNVVLVDDIISTAGSMFRAAAKLKEKGARQVDFAASHGVFAGDAIERINATDYVDRVFVTDTLPPTCTSPKIRRVTIAPFLAEVITHIHEGISVSDLIPKLP